MSFKAKYGFMIPDHAMVSMTITAPVGEMREAVKQIADMYSSPPWPLNDLMYAMADAVRTADAAWVVTADSKTEAK